MSLCSVSFVHCDKHFYTVLKSTFYARQSGCFLQTSSHAFIAHFSRAGTILSPRHSHVLGFKLVKTGHPCAG